MISKLPYHIECNWIDGGGAATYDCLTEAFLMLDYSVQMDLSLRWYFGPKPLKYFQGLLDKRADANGAVRAPMTGPLGVPMECREMYEDVVVLTPEHNWNLMQPLLFKDLSAAVLIYNVGDP